MACTCAERRAPRCPKWLLAVGLALALGGCANASARPPASAPGPNAGRPRARAFAVGERVEALVDRSRRIRLPGGRLVARPLTTIVRYPALGQASATDRRNAPADRAAGPFGLVVFGHGFAVTPRPYAPLLHAWAQAGFIVAAPVFPRSSAGAPGGPDEADIVNQPRDLRFVISQLLGASASPRSALRGMVDPREIAVSGHSDGGETALAAAFAPGFRDRRVRAALILSGAVLPRIEPFTFPRPSPALLATQGTADTTNRPQNTYRFFALAPRPKFLLRLLGAGHLPPYTTEQPQLDVIERTSIAFLQRYLDGDTGALARLRRAGNVPRTATLSGHS